MLIIRKSKLHYTATGIITPIGGRLVHRLREDVSPKYIVYACNIILNSVRKHNRFITQGNYKVTCFDYRLVILRPILSIVSQDAMHTLGSHRAYIYGIHCQD